MTRHFVRLDVTWARFVTVLEESIDMRYISGNLGRVEEKVSSQTMSAEEINQNIEQAVRHGFREVSEAEFLETQAEFRAALANRVVESLDPNARAVAWDELAASTVPIFTTTRRIPRPQSADLLCLRRTLPNAQRLADQV